MLEQLCTMFYCLCEFIGFARHDQYDDPEIDAYEVERRIRKRGKW